MWLSHLLTSFSPQRNRYLFPKYRVTHISAERFRYGYTPCVFFKDLSSSDEEDENVPISPELQELNDIINGRIVENEIYKCIKNLRKWKVMW
jgi:hypothetical protein